MDRARWRKEWLLALLVAGGVLAVNVAWVSARVGLVHKPKKVLEVDHYHYLAMARAPDGPREPAGRSPYCWRVLVPGAARLLRAAGMNVHLAFYLLTNAALLGFLLALFAYLGLLGFELRFRLLGLLLTGLLQGAVRWFEYQYWMTDPACLFLVVLGLFFARQERDGPLAVVSLVAAFVRETYVIVYPYFFLRLWRRHSLGVAVRRTLSVAAAPLAATVVLRLLIVPTSGPTLADAVADNLGFRWRHLGDNQLYVLSLGTWGMLLPLLLLYAGRLARHIPQRLEELAVPTAVYVTTILISNNNERPLAYALPVLLPAALRALQWLLADLRWPFMPVALVVLGMQVYVWVVTRFTGLGISIYQPTHTGVVALAAVFWAGALAARRLRRRA